MDKIDNRTKILVALCSVEEIGYKAKAKAIKTLESEGFDVRGIEFAKLIGAEKSVEFKEKLSNIDSLLEEMKKRDVHWITYLDDDFSQTLKDVDDCPYVLFCKGNVKLLCDDAIAVVGTRHPSRYGAKVADTFAREFARAGLVVVSGFARGIDEIAHKAAVETNSPTIAVFACGLDTVYPAEHRGLMDSIIEKDGLVISEYPLGTKPLQYHFPERNRIISGLSRALFLPEATSKSGSLITARLAIEQGKDIYVVPGSVFAAECEGSNALLREMPHALALAPEDVVEAMGFRYSAPTVETVQLDLVENQIVDALKDNELHFEDLLDMTHLTPSELNATLINLELSGVVEQTSGNYYTLI